MKDLVYSQGSRLTETLLALVALERFLLRVDVPMVSEMILTSEGFAAYITRKRSFVGVGALVNQQVVGLGELTVAILADEPLFGPCGASWSPKQPRVKPWIRSHWRAGHLCVGQI